MYVCIMYECVRTVKASSGGEGESVRSRKKELKTRPNIQAGPRDDAATQQKGNQADTADACYRRCVCPGELFQKRKPIQ